MKTLLIQNCNMTVKRKILLLLYIFFFFYNNINNEGGIFPLKMSRVTVNGQSQR